MKRKAFKKSALLSLFTFIMFIGLMGQELPEKFKEYLGTYGKLRTISYKNNQLLLQRIGGPEITLEAISKDVYKLVAPGITRALPTLNFVRDEKGSIKGLYFTHPDGQKEELQLKDTTSPAEKEPISETEKKELINKLADVLKDMYVFPDIADKYAQLLKDNMASDKYKNITDKEDLAKTITKDLNTFHKDGHLHIIEKEKFDIMMKERQEMMQKLREKEKEEKKAEDTFMNGEIIDGNIGLIEITSFPESEEAQNHAHKIMQSVKDCDAIIFDLSGNRGGTVPVIDVITSYLFDKPTHLVTMESRIENNGEAQKQISEPNEFSKKMSKIPVYLIISNVTGSAGEHFALALKTTKRGTLVGKSTFGIAHFSTWIPLTENFVGLIPFGRTYDPKTGIDWEGVGIQPDVEMEPEKALNWILNELKK